MTPKFAASSVHDGITWESPAPDFVRDSDKYIEKFEQNLATEEGMSEVEYKAVPDRYLSEFTTGYEENYFSKTWFNKWENSN